LIEKSQIIEMVFEDVPYTSLYAMFNELILESESLNSEKELLNNKTINARFTDKLLLTNENISIQFNAKKICFKNIYFKNIILRIVKYGATYDIDFSTEQRDSNISSNLIEFQTCMQKLANKYKVENNYFGMEPASDEDTRYFTREIIGPLKINE
jgi:hypothetical protein